MNGCQFSREVMNAADKLQAFNNGGLGGAGRSSRARVQTTGLSEEVPDYGATESGRKSRKTSKASSKKEKHDKDRPQAVFQTRPAVLSPLVLRSAAAPRRASELIVRGAPVV